MNITERYVERAKSLNNGEILVAKVGDFFEIMGADAVRAAPVLEAVITKRSGVPMCGFPAHAEAKNRALLVSAGFTLVDLETCATA